MDRQSVILAEAQRFGRVTVDRLAQDLQVSAHTIRRDINALCEQSKLRRLHGGAEFIEGSANLPYGARTILNEATKQKIAFAAAQLISDGSTIALSIGTTPALVATCLAQKESITLVTNNLNAAMAISENSGNRVILPGGELRLPDRDFVNQAALDMFSAYRVDFGIYGVGGIDYDGSLLDFHEEEVLIRQAISSNSRQSILVADRSKFGRRAAAIGGHLREPDHVIIDSQPGPDFAALFSMAEYPFQIVGEPS